MSRKKKTKTDAAQEVKQEKTFAKNSTNINYYGHVNLKFKVGEKTFEYKGKNNGTYTLKSMLCMFLCGYRDVFAAIPAKLDLRYSAGGSAWTSCLNSPIALSGMHGKYQDDAETNIPRAVFTATIKYSNLNKTISEGDSNSYRLYLLSEENNLMTDTSLAYLEVEAAKLAKIQPGTDGIVEWVMELLNLDEAKTVIDNQPQSGE